MTGEFVVVVGAAPLLCRNKCNNYRGDKVVIEVIL